MVIWCAMGPAMDPSGSLKKSGLPRKKGPRDSVENRRSSQSGWDQPNGHSLGGVKTRVMEREQKLEHRRKKKFDV